MNLCAFLTELCLVCSKWDAILGICVMITLYLMKVTLRVTHRCSNTLIHFALQCTSESIFKIKYVKV